MKTPSLDFDRWDYGATKVLLVGALLAVPLFVVGLPLLSWVTGGPLVRSVLVGIDDGAPVTDPAVRSGVEAVWGGAARVAIDDATAGMWILTLLPSVVISGAAVLVAWSMLGLVRMIQRGDSFKEDAVTRLRTVGLTLLLAPWVHYAVAGFANSAVLERAFRSPTSFSIVVDQSTLVISVLGLAIGAMAEAFRQGNRLRADVDGLV